MLVYRWDGMGNEVTYLYEEVIRFMPHVGCVSPLSVCCCTMVKL